MAVIKTIANTDYASTPIAYKRGNPIPIDTTLVWYDMTELETYAASGATAYVGQVLAYVDSDNNTASAYLITNEAGALMKLAATTTSGDLAGDLATLQAEVNTLKGRVDALGALAGKDEITKDDLAEALKTELEGKANAATTLAGYGITDAYTKTEIDNKIAGAFHFKGEVNYQDLLPTDATEGDVYVVKYLGSSANAGTNPYNAEFAWNGTAWIEIGGTIDLSGYVQKETNYGLSRVREISINDATDPDTSEEYRDIIVVMQDETELTADFYDRQQMDNKLENYVSKEEGKGLSKVSDVTLDRTDTIWDDELKIDHNVWQLDASYQDGSSIGGVEFYEKGAVDTLLKNINKKTDANAKAIENINKAETGILDTAKKYAEAQDTALKKELTSDINKKVDKTTIASDETLGLIKVDSAHFGISEDGVLTLESVDGAKVFNSVHNAVEAVYADAPLEIINISYTGDVTGGVEIRRFDQMDAIESNLTLADTGVTAGQYTKVTVDAKGRVTAGSALALTDVSSIDGIGDIITHDVDEFATSEQGAKADSAVQSVAGVSGTEITAEQLKTATGYIEADDDIQFSGNISFDKLPTTGASVDESTSRDSLVPRGYVDDTITSKIAASNAMIYKGTVGEGGTVSTLPTSNVKNGDTYKVITDGVVSGAFVGDIVIAVVSTGEDESVSIDWTLIPSGDDGNVNTTGTLTVGQLVVGNGNKEVITLANGTKGQVLGQGDSGLEWQTPDTYSVSSESLSVTPTTADGNTDYKVELTSVSTDLLAQGNDVLIFDCGDSGVTTVTE